MDEHALLTDMEGKFMLEANPGNKMHLFASFCKCKLYQAHPHFA